MLKQVTYKLEETKLEVIKELCDKANLKQADFINFAIDNAIDMLVNEAGGGTQIVLPSPFINQEMTEETKEKVIQLLNDCSYKFTQLVGGRFNVGLNLINEFTQTTLRATNEEKERYLSNYQDYLNIKSKIKGGER